MRYLFVAVFFLAFLSLQAQPDKLCPRYETFMKVGEAFKQKEKYTDALNNFLSAQIAARECEKSTDAANKQIQEVFKQIAKQRDDAVKAKQNADFQKNLARKAFEEAAIALKETQSEKVKTQFALNKADSSNAQNKKLIDAFYFYDGKLALAFKDDKYGFINKNGDPVIPYLYQKAEQFDNTGFAKVKLKEDDKLVDYLLDTTGNKFKVAYTLEDLKASGDFTALDLRGISFDSFPKEILSHTQLKILIIYNYYSSSLPEQIEGLKSLTSLDLSYNQLSSLPTQIGELQSLTNLNLSHNYTMRSLPSQIGELKSLVNLNLSHNLGLYSLPSQIGRLKSLKNLDLSFNRLDSLPEQIGGLESLTSLNFSCDDYNISEYHKLKSLPGQIGRLKSLKSLNLIHTQLSSLPTQIGELKSLTNLDLSFNRLDSLPELIGALKSLTSLDLSYNQLSSLPTQIGELKSLTNLNLGQNPRLYSLPSQVGELKSLKSLNLSGSQLKNLPTQIGELKSLTTLYLNNNQLSSLPAQIGELKNLTTLNLSGNNLRITSAQVGELKSLTSLDLDSNQLSSLVEQIGDLESMPGFDLKNNQLSGLQEELFLIKSLNYLEVRVNNNSDVYRIEVSKTAQILLDVYESKLDTLKYDAFKKSGSDHFENVENIFTNRSKKDIELAGKLSGYYGKRSWYLLFASKFKEAEQAAKKGLTIVPANIWIKTNLAHSSLFQGNYEEALKVYQELKLLKNANGKSYAAICIEDLDELEKNGVLNKDVNKIRAFLKQ